MSRRPVVFLDKDGTVIEDLPYNVDPRRVRFAPGARQGIRLLAAAGHPMVIASNQSGVARGYFTEDELRVATDHLRHEMEGLGADVLGMLWCPHIPDGINEYAIDCACRKPLPGMVDRAVHELGVDTTGGWFVGDTWMDAAAGRAAGLRTIIVGPDHVTAHELPDDRRPDHAVADLLDAARVIVTDVLPDLATVRTAAGGLR